MPFTGPEKLRLDQYVMNGGHILMAVNTLNASLDSLRIHPPQIMAMENNLDLDDLLFRYGARVNNDLVEDEQNLGLARTMNDGSPQLHDWIYFPKLNPIADHPIVRNMDFIRAGFSNSIDTIRTAGVNIKKTVLLSTSKHSLKADAPVRVSLSMMNFPLQDQMFTKSYLPVAVLLEGKFVSAFKNKLAPEYLKFLADSLHMPYKQVCDSSNSMIITSVGDIFINDYSPANGIRPMGYYLYTNEYFANRDFLLNCIEYLTDHSGVLEARSKESKLRLLDVSRARDEKTKWQTVNVAIPVAIVLVFASAYFFFRKRRYEIRSENKKTLPENA
jgi:ABC-2 type transport system permease protein